jgi:hypothetical protein
VSKQNQILAAPRPRQQGIADCFRPSYHDTDESLDTTSARSRSPSRGGRWPGVSSTARGLRLGLSQTSPDVRRFTHSGDYSHRAGSPVPRRWSPSASPADIGQNGDSGRLRAPLRHAAPPDPVTGRAHSRSQSPRHRERLLHRNANMQHHVELSPRRLTGRHRQHSRSSAAQNTGLPERSGRIRTASPRRNNSRTRMTHVAEEGRDHRRHAGGTGAEASDVHTGGTAGERRHLRPLGSALLLRGTSSTGRRSDRSPTRRFLPPPSNTRVPAPVQMGSREWRSSHRREQVTTDQSSRVPVRAPSREHPLFRPRLAPPASGGGRLPEGTEARGDRANPTVHRATSRREHHDERHDHALPRSRTYHEVSSVRDAHVRDRRRSRSRGSSSPSRTWSHRRR